ncbi:integrase, catalytic region, zinc finger, CCHC-type containing protein [Tanacetum coccineum]
MRIPPRTTEERGMIIRGSQCAGLEENVVRRLVQKSGIQCYNCKEYGHVLRECQKPKRVKDAAYHKELEAHLCTCTLQEVTPDQLENSGPIFDQEPIIRIKVLESSNNHFKEANNELSKTNQLMFKDLKKFQAELDKYNDVNYASKVEIDCAKAKGDLMTRQPMAVPVSTREPKHNVNQSVATFSKKTVATDSTVKKSRNITRKLYEQLVEIILFIVDSGCSKHMTGNLKLLTNFVEKFLGTVKFGNDQIAPILGYGDLVQGTITIKRVYYIEGLNHNLFSVGQFCDADLEVAFRKSTCYIRDLKGNDLLTGSRGTDLYSISLQDSTTPNPICLMAKATSSQAWLWHRRLSHLNFDTINLLLKNNIMNGLPKLKFIKDHLCSSCELGKAKRKVLIDFLTLVQRGLHAQVTTVRTDKGTEFLNKTLHAYFAKEGIRHETSTARTPEQNGVVERRNRTLVEVAQIMLSVVKVPLFFWAEAIATAYGENLDKMKEKGDACIFVGYSTQSKAYRVFNKRTIMIVETIHVNFVELPQMASDHVSSDPGPQCLTTVLEQDSLSPGPKSQENVPQVAKTVTTSNELELLYSPMFNELLNENSPVVSKSSAVHAADNPDKRQQHNTTHTSITTDVADPPPLNIHSTHQTPTQVPTVTAPENIIQAETNTENA